MIKADLIQRLESIRDIDGRSLEAPERRYRELTQMIEDLRRERLFFDAQHERAESADVERSNGEDVELKVTVFGSTWQSMRLPPGTTTIEFTVGGGSGGPDAQATPPGL